jgi:hypothetical protein
MCAALRAGTGCRMLARIEPPPNIHSRTRAFGAHVNAFVRVSVVGGVSFCSAAAAAPEADGWRHWVSDKVLICAAAAVGLFILSLLLRGLLKVISLVLVLVLVAGAFWLLRDTWEHRAELLPREWTELAQHTLDSPKAQEAWKSVESELAHLSATARERLAAGTDSARRNVQAKLEAKARELRKEGSSSEADQIAHLAELMGKQK